VVDSENAVAEVAEVSEFAGGATRETARSVELAGGGGGGR